MARQSLTSVTNDLQDDSGSVLWSFVQGEQLEYPVTLNFLTNAGYGYVYEAVVIEADNFAGSTVVPTTAKAGGVSTTLTVRVPFERGPWDASTEYNREDVVTHGGLTYKLSMGTNYVSETTPIDDAVWVVYVPNKCYLQFPANLSLDWAVQPTNASPVYGFIELRVTEPSGGVYTRTWKPLRGLVEILYSPTQMVP